MENLLNEEVYYMADNMPHKAIVKGQVFIQSDDGEELWVELDNKLRMKQSDIFPTHGDILAYFNRLVRALDGGES